MNEPLPPNPANHHGNGTGHHAAEPETILVVDDYADICQLVSRMLKAGGYRVFTAGSGAAAQRIATENARINLLLTDIEMPQMRGDELAAWFRSTMPDTQIVFMSSLAGVSTGEPVDFVHKPFRAEVLLGKVREVLNRKSCS